MSLCLIWLAFGLYRENALKLVVTAADISAVVKAWHVQQNTVNAIYKEFYSQVNKMHCGVLARLGIVDI